MSHLNVSYIASWRVFDFDFPFLPPSKSLPPIILSQIPSSFLESFPIPSSNIHSFPLSFLSPFLLPFLPSSPTIPSQTALILVSEILLPTCLFDTSQSITAKEAKMILCVCFLSLVMEVIASNSLELLRIQANRFQTLLLQSRSSTWKSFGSASGPSWGWN